jgi:diguanylate cyclase (GGDEF)-like protein
MPSSSLWIYLCAGSLLLVAYALWLYWQERQQRINNALQLERMAAEMAAQVEFDRLTGLLSHGGFDAVLDKVVRDADASFTSLCLLYVGLDNFELFNDAFGRQVGDLVLKQVAQRLARCNSGASGICRLTAGEFVLVVKGDLLTGLGASKRVTDVFLKPFQVESIMTLLTCSIGMAIYPEHGSRDKLLGHAAMAMRSVKIEGGGSLCQYDPKMGRDVIEQAVLVNELRNAMDLGQLELYFQPKIDAISLKVTAAEALLRWHHPKRGTISPAIFIPLAERFGLIGPIGNWVIQEACRHAAAWREHGLRMRVAVNISGYQMREDDLVERIEEELLRTGIQPGRFTCEITESVAMEDTVVTQRTFDKMRKAGFHVSIDDFGTGYSSLSTLRKLPAAELKIDRAFVSDLEESEDARSIARSIVNLANALNLRVVAEGVETEGQRDILVDMGCDELQGFLFCKPISADHLQRMALSGNQSEDVPFSQSLFNETARGGLT